MGIKIREKLEKKKVQNFLYLGVHANSFQSLFIVYLKYMSPMAIQQIFQSQYRIDKL